MKRVLVGLFIAILFCPMLKAEDVRFDIIRDRDGLSHNTVRAILQGQEGFMWFGTLDGLDRFNGKSIVEFKPEAGGLPSLNDNRIRSLYQDSYQNLWLRSMGGEMSCYSPLMDRFIDYCPQRSNKRFSGILETSRNELFLYGRYGCLCLSRNGGEWVTVPADSMLTASFINFICEDVSHNVWIGSSKGLFRISNALTGEVFSRNQFERVSAGSWNLASNTDKGLIFYNGEGLLVYDHYAFRQVAFPGGNSYSIYRAASLPDGHILLSHREGMVCYNCNKGQFESAAPLFDNENVRGATFFTDNRGNVCLYNGTGNVWIWVATGRFEKYRLLQKELLSSVDGERYDVLQDSRNDIWITTYGSGLFRINGKTGQLEHFTTSNSALPADFLLCVTEDRTGEIWVGTEHSGVVKISVSHYPVEVFCDTECPGTEIPKAFKAIFQDSQKRYWFGTTGGGLLVYDAAREHCLRRFVNERRPFHIGEDPSGNIWVGYKGSGLQVFDGNSLKQVAEFTLTGSTSSTSNVYDFIFDRKGRLWVATFGGGLLCCEHPLYPYNQVDFQRIELKGNQYMRAICEDGEGYVWVGTDNGVMCFCPDSLLAGVQQVWEFVPESGKEGALGSQEVKSVFLDSRNDLWFAAMGDGLNRLVRRDPISESAFEHFNSANGLSNSNVQAILEDDLGNLWVSTESNVVSRLILSEKRFENFDIAMDGSRVFTESCGWRLSDGRLMFGGDRGAIVLDPANMRYNPNVPPVLITRLAINGESLRPGEKDSPLSGNITSAKHVKLPPGRKTVTIEFAMLDFQNPRWNSYSYRLAGYEKEWNAVTRHNEATYRNLPPGHYVFEVKGCNSQGIWTDETTTLSLEVATPFWMSWTAWLMYILLLAAVVIWVVRTARHFRELNTAVEVEKQLTEYKLRFFTNISHEFRTPLAIIQGALESLTDMNGLPSQADNLILQIRRNSARLLRLIDQLLDFRKLQNKGMELSVERTEVVGFLREIFENFREMASRKHILLTFETECEEQEMYIDRGKFDKMLYNLLSNAMKFTPENGQIEVALQFSQSEDYMRMSVSDSGPGVAKERRKELFERFAQLGNLPSGTGIGLHMTAEMARTHKGDIVYEDSPYGGARFTVTVPLADSNYMAEIARRKNVVNEAQREGMDLPEEGAFNDFRILVIEDEDEVREIVAGQLGKYFQVQTAPDGVAGLQIALDSQPDLIVCDVMMPGLSGFEVTSRLKEEFSTSHIPVILLTAYSSEESELKGATSGADAYITKPFSTKFLIARIVGLISQREALRQKFAQSPGTDDVVETYSSRDKEFMEKIDALIEKNMDNPDFSVFDMFTLTSRMGRTTFYKKLKGISGYTPNDYLRTMRLKRAAELLTSTDLNISEISYAIGMNDPLYFSKSFKAQFGKSPSDFRKSGSIRR